jgi:hypothetical protein
MLLSSVIERKRKRRRGNGNGNGNGNQIIHTRRNWFLKGQAYTESETIGGYATSVNADGTVVVNAGRNASNAPFLNVGRWNSGSQSWSYSKINLAVQNGEIVTSISDDGNVIAVGFEGYDVGGYTSNTNVIVYEWNSSSWSQRGSAISTRSVNCSIDISGDGSVLAIGEPFFGATAPTNTSGDTRVRIFKWSGSSWSAHGNTILKAGVGGSQIFGWKVSLNGSGDTVAIGTQASNSGVDIYRLNGSTWSQLGNRSQYETDGWYGGCDAVKLDSTGNFVVIAGYLNQDNDGTVRIFRWTDSTWTKIGNDIIQPAYYSNDEPDVSLSMDGTASRIIVGTRQLDSGGGDRSIKVYDWNGTSWELSATVSHGAANSNNGFNPKLSRDGQTMTFGAPNTKTSAVYTTTFNIWSQLGLDIDGEAVGDQSGNNISMNAAGDRVAIGASGNDGNDGNNTNRGHVRVYNWTGSSWTQLGQDIDGEAVGDNSRQVSMNAVGDRVAIGASNNDGNDTDRGHVRVYNWTGSSWTQLGQDIDGEVAGGVNSFFGTAVSMNAVGDRLAIGASGNDSSGIDRGEVQIYSFSNGSWTKLGQDINGEAASDYFGYSVSMNAAGDRVAIGAIYNDGNGTDRGHVRVYNWTGSSWTQLGQDIDGEADNDESGCAVSINAAGDRIAIGAFVNGNNRGHVRIYSWNGSSWVQLGSDIDGEAVGDDSGYSVSMNSAGDIVAIGARSNDGNGTDSGHVRVYSWNGSSWVQLGSDIDGEAAFDLSGTSVSMNSAGDRVAIGAIWNSNYKGHVRVYNLT